MNLGVLLQDPSDLRFKCTLGDTAFSVSASQIWNALPANITNQAIFNNFKTMLKTYFITKAFSSML